MRMAGHLDNEKHAHLLSDYLHARGMQNEVEQTPDGKWALWIYDDARLEEGRLELEQFLAAPDAPVYRQNAGKGRAAVEERRREDERFRRRMVDVRTTWVGMHQAGIGWLTAILIALSVIVTLFSGFGDSNSVRWLVQIDAPSRVAGDYMIYGEPLDELRRGQIWRLVTPIFLHFSILHLLFNMLWLKQLGTALELHEGTVRLGLQVLVFAVASNLAQYFISGPTFGGMSGVVYGLFGYVWIRGRYDPRRPYALDRNSVIMMVGWFFLCFTGLVGPIANTAHAVGLALGVLWAALAIRRIPFTGIRW